LKQGIQIIGGRYRGKKLSVPEVEGLRPTPNRVRETVFNWLMHTILDARCLDAFAGSGALGFEAFSRGASTVVFLEQDPRAAAHLQQTLSAFKTPKLLLHQTDALSFLKQSKDVFDLIFLDPPFSHNKLGQCLDILTNQPLLPQGGLVYLESNQDLEPNPKQWQVLKQKQAGQVQFGLLQKR
jgi:16S rRNA (guanine966-N2)-methyltransferase